MSAVERVAAPDCAIPGERVSADIERAYRRGFVQGVAFATRAVEGGASGGALRDWLDRLHRWRQRVQRARELATAELPPMPNFRGCAADDVHDVHHVHDQRGGKP